jgi:uncharacterized protein (DUF1810 family)
MTDPYNLQRFVDAQNPVFRGPVDELFRNTFTGQPCVGFLDFRLAPDLRL